MKRRALLSVFAGVTGLLVACGGGTPASSPRDTGEGGGKSCLMVNVCGCNLGCGSIPLSRAQLVDGVQTRVENGPLRGFEVKVVDVTDATGAHVFALTDLEHDHGCSVTKAERSLLGYGCASGKSGPVPARACASGCD